MRALRSLSHFTQDEDGLAVRPPELPHRSSFDAQQGYIDAGMSASGVIMGGGGPNSSTPARGMARTPSASGIARTVTAPANVMHAHSQPRQTGLPPAASANSSARPGIGASPGGSFRALGSGVQPGEPSQATLSRLGRGEGLDRLGPQQLLHEVPPIQSEVGDTPGLPFTASFATSEPCLQRVSVVRLAAVWGE